MSEQPIEMIEVVYVGAELPRVVLCIATDRTVQEYNAFVKVMVLINSKGVTSLPTSSTLALAKPQTKILIAINC